MSENTGKINKTVLVFLAVMTVLTAGVFHRFEISGMTVSLSGISVLVGLAAYFITAKTNESRHAGLDIKRFPGQLRDIRLIVLILMPTVMNLITTLIEKAFLPEYADFLRARIEQMLDPSQIKNTVISLVVLALGEEIAWRAFFQKQTTKFMGFVPSLLVSSALFAVGHFTAGKPAIVAFDLAGVFINALFYGLVFKRTDNAWCSWLSHFLANVSGVALMYYGL